MHRKDVPTTTCCARRRGPLGPKGPTSESTAVAGKRQRPTRRRSAQRRMGCQRVRRAAGGCRRVAVGPRRAGKAASDLTNGTRARHLPKTVSQMCVPMRCGLRLPMRLGRHVENYHPSSVHLMCESARFREPGRVGTASNTHTHRKRHLHRLLARPTAPPAPPRATSRLGRRHFSPPPSSSLPCSSWSPATMLVKVKLLTGTQTEIDIDSTDTIARIKERVEEKDGIDPRQQRLIFGGKQLADDKRADEYNIGTCRAPSVCGFGGGDEQLSPWRKRVRCLPRWVLAAVWPLVSRCELISTCSIIGWFPDLALGSSLSPAILVPFVSPLPLFFVFRWCSPHACPPHSLVSCLRLPQRVAPCCTSSLPSAAACRRRADDAGGCGIPPDVPAKAQPRRAVCSRCHAAATRSSLGWRERTDCLANAGGDRTGGVGGERAGGCGSGRCGWRPGGGAGRAGGQGG